MERTANLVLAPKLLKLGNLIDSFILKSETYIFPLFHIEKLVVFLAFQNGKGAPRSIPKSLVLDSTLLIARAHSGKGKNPGIITCSPPFSDR